MSTGSALAQPLLGARGRNPQFPIPLCSSHTWAPETPRKKNTTNQMSPPQSLPAKTCCLIAVNCINCIAPKRSDSSSVPQSKAGQGEADDEQRKRQGENPSPGPDPDRHRRHSAAAHDLRAQWDKASRAGRVCLMAGEPERSPGKWVRPRPVA